jgi:hypothetical protein
VFHLTAVLHKYDSRLVTNLKPNIRWPEQRNRNSCFWQIMYDFSSMFAGGTVPLHPRCQGQIFAHDTRSTEWYETRIEWHVQVCCICAAANTRRCKNCQQMLCFAHWHFPHCYLFIIARMRIFLLYTLLTSNCEHPTTGPTIPVILFILPRNLYFVHIFFYTVGRVAQSV